MNESVLRSPKWLRNIVDFEINTSDDIKGEQKLDSKRKQEEEASRIRTEEQKKINDKRKEKKFDELFRNVEAYIVRSYKNCDTSIIIDVITVEKKSLNLSGIDFEFKVALKYNINIPTFNVNILHGKERYNYVVSGLLYANLKNFFVSTIFEWYKYTQNSKQSKNYGSRSQKTTSNSYSQSKPTESDEIRDKRRKYIFY
jgi:hypothetical protein